MLINCPSEELRRRCKSVGYSEVLGIGQNFSLSSLRRSLRRQVFWHFFKSQASSSLATQSSSWWASRKKCKLCSHMAFHAHPCHLRVLGDEHEFCHFFKRRINFCYSEKQMSFISEQHEEDLAFHFAQRQVIWPLMAIKKTFLPITNSFR